MADKKISALTGATTPLAGSEVLPIVQGGSTVKVSVDNLTAGKEVPASKITISTGADALSMWIKGRAADNVSNIFFNNNADTAQYGYVFASPSEVGISSIGARPLSLGANGSTAFQVNTAGNLYVVTAGKGIDFSANANAPGMTSEVLNWYEEGVFTPTFTGLTVGNGTVFGFYRRIGKQVFVTFGFILGSTSAVGSLTGLSGLPFTTGTVGGSRFFTVNGVAFKQGVGGFPAYSLLYSASTAGSGPASTNTNLGMNATAPFTWAADDSLSMTATYFVD